VDDLTSRAAARATDRHLVLYDEALLHLERMGERLGRDLVPLNEKQALMPAKAFLIPNPLGTACGFRLQEGNCTLFFLPGVPSEMVRMLEESVIPQLLARGGRHRFSASSLFKIFGPSEAELDALTRDLHRPAEGVSIAFRVLLPEIFLKVRADGPPSPALGDLYQRTVADLRQRLGEMVYAEGEETMESVVARLLSQRGRTVTTAESCTGGLLAARLTSIPGSSDYFRQGVVSYADDAKSRLLGVSRELLRSRGAVSDEVAAEMAKGARRASGSDIALAVTGIAGPEGGTPAKPVGTVHIALADAASCTVSRHLFRGSREDIRALTVFAALDRLRRHLTPPVSAATFAPRR
jgi:nicotinamide-nucleotide amidase